MKTHVGISEIWVGRGRPCALVYHQFGVWKYKVYFFFPAEAHNVCMRMYAWCVIIHISHIFLFFPLRVMAFSSWDSQHTCSNNCLLKKVRQKQASLSYPTNSQTLWGREAESPNPGDKRVVACTWLSPALGINECWWCLSNCCYF